MSTLGERVLQVESFFDAQTSTFSHLVHAGAGSACAVIDPVLGYDLESGRLDSAPADALLRALEARHLQVQWILETHIHADHLTAAAYLRERSGGRVAAGPGIGEVQRTFQARFQLPEDYCQASGQFDHLFAPDEDFTIGALSARALHVPGHTPADTAFLIEERQVFVGDTLFQPDIGTARCDFPGGSAARLYRSIRHLLELPGDTRLFMCHDYPQDRAPRAWCCVEEQRLHNQHMHQGVSAAQFIEWREERDAGLEPPRLLIPALLWNLRAGVLPDGDVAGVRFRWTAG
ncbi:MBL fold metallo-hydrolase [Phytopseudomonas flavescens]|uniref:MBL fold metallo-hydrolase n=1 Tax=Phytopseudomonas flavescens TaxID=29435 RepID=UPI001582FFF2|nr:MBL fold metallo-hydrolase [Pseudomonas flavescens]